MTHSDVHQTMQMLRIHLLDMCRVSQRCVDYSVKAYQLGNPDLVASVRDNAFEINLLHSETIAIAQDLLLKEQIPHSRDLRFVLSSIRLCDAFRSIHNSTVEIASNIMRFWGAGGDFAVTDFPEMGDPVNGLVKLCSESLIEEAIEAAQMVLYSDRFENEFETTFYHWYRTIAAGERAQAKYAFAITRHLSQIVQHAREIADALVFWLDDLDERPLPEAGDIDLQDHLTAESIEAVEAAMLGDHLFFICPANATTDER